MQMANNMRQQYISPQPNWSDPDSSFVPNRSLSDIQNRANALRPQYTNAIYGTTGQQPVRPTYAPQSRTSQFMQQMYQTPGVRRTTTRNFAQLPAYMQPGYVPGRNLAQDMPEKTYRKIFHQPMTVAMQTYPQGYADEGYQQPYSGGYGGYGDYDYGGGGLGAYQTEKGYTGPSDWNRTKGYKPYANDVPRWLQGLVTWRF
jgi:hypothetical protein